ncbi:hypothetical protein QEN19_000364 [Hanseniaspora menglaensis]
MRNQQEFDYNHATDEQYSELRAKAQEAMNQSSNFSQKSQNSYKQGDKVEAKQFSEQSKKFRAQANNFNEQAANYVFQQNNMDSSQVEIDLHGLYVHEAEWVMKRRIYMAVKNKEQLIEVIVGKGLHSKNHVAKIKPAMEDICSEYNLTHYPKSGNSGVMCIALHNVQLSNLPDEWYTMSYDSYLSSSSGKPEQYSKPQSNNYNYQQGSQHHQQQSYNNNQQGPQYHQQQSYNNNQQHYNQNQANNNSSDGCSVVTQIIKLIVSFLK